MIETLGTTALDQAQDQAALATHHSSRGADFICRTIDLVIAALVLVLTLPLMLAVAAAIRLDSPGPVLFRQRRLGRALAPFTVLKFRTMEDGAADTIHRVFVTGLIAGAQPSGEAGTPRFKLARDDRVTRVGRVLRRASIDELPQLWNVIRGEMSLVGPRPSIPYEVDQYPLPWMERFAVKPGLTGLWQVSGRSELAMPDMVKLDIEYVRHRSVLLNLWILIRTVPVVLSLRGAS